MANSAKISRTMAFMAGVSFRRRELIEPIHLNKARRSLRGYTIPPIRARTYLKGMGIFTIAGPFSRLDAQPSAN